MADFLLNCRGMRDFHPGRFVLNFIFLSNETLAHQKSGRTAIRQALITRNQCCSPATSRFRQSEGKIAEQNRCCSLLVGRSSLLHMREMTPLTASCSLVDTTERMPLAASNWSPEAREDAARRRNEPPSSLLPSSPWIRFFTSSPAASVSPLHLSLSLSLSTLLVHQLISPIHPYQDLHIPLSTASTPNPIHPSIHYTSSSSSPSLHRAFHRSMASTTSDSLPSSPSLPTTAALDAAADQEFSSHHHHSLFLPSPSSPASLYLDSSFHGLLPASSSTPMSPSHQAPPLPPPAAPSKPPKKRPRASRRPPTTVLTTDTSNFRAMVQEFTGFPAPPFAASPPPAVRQRLFGGASAVGPPFLMRPSPLKYPHNPVLLPPTCTTTTLANTTTTSINNITSTSSLVDALALFAKSNVMPSTAAASAAGGSSADQYGHGMGAFNPFDDFEAAAEGEKANAAGHGFFSSLGGAGDKYDRH